MTCSSLSSPGSVSSSELLRARPGSSSLMTLGGPLGFDLKAQETWGISMREEEVPPCWAISLASGGKDNRGERQLGEVSWGSGRRGASFIIWFILSCPGQSSGTGSCQRRLARVKDPLWPSLKTYPAHLRFHGRNSRFLRLALSAFTILAWPAPVQTSVGPQIRGHLPDLPDHVRLLFSKFLLTCAHLHLGPVTLLANVCLQGCLPSVCEL